MLSLVARHIKNLGFSLVEAPDGDAAWELAQKHHPDLVILDVMMSGMSGWEVCKRLKSSRESDDFSATGVIMLTGIGENLNEMTSPLYAADAWLNKPFEFGELDRKIGEVLEHYGKQMPRSRSATARSAASPKKAPAKAKKQSASKVRTGPAAKKSSKPAAKKAPAPARRSK
jgi:DNA-binding response OmpR family regulator